MPVFKKSKTDNFKKEIISFKKRIKLLEREKLHLEKKNEEGANHLNRLYTDLQDAYIQTIKTLARAIDARDHYTHSHSEDVTRYAVSIAKNMHLKPKEIEEIEEACELHDLGKIGIQDYILSKNGSLNDEEWVQIKLHPSKAAEILKPLKYLGRVIDIIHQHHERFDGGGYPEGRKGKDILLGARIIALADAYNAMTSARSYRKVPLTKEEAIEEIKRNSGTQFDPKVVEIFLKIVDRL